MPKISKSAATMVILAILATGCAFHSETVPQPQSYDRQNSSAPLPAGYKRITNAFFTFDVPASATVLSEQDKSSIGYYHLLLDNVIVGSVNWRVDVMVEDPTFLQPPKTPSDVMSYQAEIAKQDGDTVEQTTVAGLSAIRAFQGYSAVQPTYISYYLATNGRFYNVGLEPDSDNGDHKALNLIGDTIMQSFQIVNGN